MGQAFTQGLRAALRRWPVALVLFAFQLAAGLIFAAAAWSWLLEALDDSLASRTLLTNLDWNVFVDLIAHHGESLRQLLSGGILLAVPLLLLGVWLNATAVVAVGEDGSLGDCLRRGLTLYPRFLAMSVLTAVLALAGVGCIVMLGRLLTRWTAESASELTPYVIAAGCGITSAGLLVFLLSVHDHARVRCTARGTGAFRAYAWAVRFVTRREWRALPLEVLLLAIGFSVWAVYQSVGMLLHATSAHGVVISLLWGQAFVLLRMLLRVWSFAATTELQGLRQ